MAVLNIPQTPFLMKNAGLQEQMLSKHAAFASTQTSRESHGCISGIFSPEIRNNCMREGMYPVNSFVLKHARQVLSFA